MVIRIEIGLKACFRDPRGAAAVAAAADYLNLSCRGARTVDVYKIDAAVAPGEVPRVLEALLDPVLQDGAEGKLPPPADYRWSVTVGFKPGVKDNVGDTARVTLEDALGRSLGEGARVYTERRYLFDAPELDREAMERIAWGCIANPLIQRVTVEEREAFEASEPDLAVPVVRERAEPRVRTVDLSGSDAELLRISREGMLSLSLEELHAVRDHFRARAEARAARRLPPHPTDAELEVIAQTWSEHCKHKIFNASIRYREGDGPEEEIHSLFRTYIQASTEEIGRRVGFLVSVFHDNAGVIRFNERWHLVYKVETHNSPSALDPYGGAITGIVGVNRDPFGTGRGAALLANVWGYCFASPFHEGPLPKGLLHPRRVRDGVHQGVIDGGNQSGIPMMRGWEWFDERYLGKPLVYCGTVGIMPHEVCGRPAHEKVVRPGYKVVMVGGRIGKDGIHGATFSSRELDEASPVQAVQIGDPITQKKMTDFLLEARDRGLYTAITDNGAGGLSSSVGEMARLSGGCEMDLARAPLKYEGLQPWEILLSEAQERMTLAVPPEKEEALLELAAARDVEATVLGSFTDSGYFHVRHGELEAAWIDMAFLHEGCPPLELEAAWEPPPVRRAAPAAPEDLSGELASLLGRLNLCSKEAKVRQYDHEVKGLSVVKPYTGVEGDVPADATVMRVELGRPDGIVLAEGVNPRYSDVDTYWMAASVIDLALRRVVAAGGDPDHAAGLDNFCWPDPVQSEKTPDGRFKLAQLVRACKALDRVTRAYDLPCISGKDSMKNDTVLGGVKISIPPTLLFSVVARIADVGKAVTLDAKAAGDLVYVLGETRDEPGGSEYLAMKGEAAGGGPLFDTAVPRLYPEEARPLYRALHRAVEEGLVRSAHTPALGGLGAGFAFTAMAGMLGIEAQLGAVPGAEAVGADWRILFSESNARFIVTVAPEHTARFEALMAGLPCARVGVVTGTPRVRIYGRTGKPVVEAEVGALKERWKAPLREV